MNVNGLYEHEIPDGSKLYFAESAAQKRHIENVAAQILVAQGFDEIITPFFSFHQSYPTQQLVRFSDRENHQVALRADSTEDAVRLIRKRLKNSQNRWFYIQPVFRYPTSEIYQIGIEILNSSDLTECLRLAEQIFTALNIRPTLQLSNIAVVKQICKELQLSTALFENGEIEAMFALKHKWLDKLVTMQDLGDLKEAMQLAPEFLRAPLLELQKLSEVVKTEFVFSPLYYSKMHYYDKLFFRFLSKNQILCSGGAYEIDGQNAVGFAIFVDELLSYEKEKNAK